MAGAVYIARQTTRNMKKSASSRDHYFVRWGNALATNQMMLLLAEPPNYVTLKSAKEILDKKMVPSVAISRDIILTLGMEPNTYEIIFRGLPGGSLRNDVYEASFSGCPLAARVKAQIQEY